MESAFDFPQKISHFRRLELPSDVILFSSGFEIYIYIYPVDESRSKREKRNFTRFVRRNIPIKNFFPLIESSVRIPSPSSQFPPELANY